VQGRHGETQDHCPIGNDPDEISLYSDGASGGPGSGMCADQERQTPPRIVTAAIKSPGQQG